MNLFISDLHIGHEHVLYFDNRPFRNINDHDELIAERWNNNVCPDDDVYILGDVSFKNVTATIDYYSKLNGKKHLILGNHDKAFLKNKDFREIFVEIEDYKELYITPQCSVVLSHYPILSYKNLYRGWIHLYGHVHNSFEWGIMEHHKDLMKDLYSKKDGKKAEDVFNAYNVGCMLPYMGYTPHTLEHIIDCYNATHVPMFVNPIKNHSSCNISSND